MKLQTLNLRKIALLLFFLALFVGVGAGLLPAQQASITQIDPSQLLLGQTTRLYARLLDAQGAPVENPDPAGLSIMESGDGRNYLPVRDLRLITGSNRTGGITFLFLMDNSGSMYDTLEGQPTDDPAATRVQAARKAAEYFLLAASGPADTVGLAAFNTRYTLLVPPSADRQATAAALEAIARPAREDGYTELYAAIDLACADLRAMPGRKALIVLSDGANYHYADFENRDNPQFGSRRHTAPEALEAAVREGLTVFTVNYGPDAKDSGLAAIALKSGGDVFDARDGEELRTIYRTIRDRILTEVLLEYRATMQAGDKRWVKLAWAPANPAVSPERYYYVGTVYGDASGPFPWGVLAAIPVALLAWFVLSRLKFDKPSTSANLSLLYSPDAGKLTKVFPVGNQTIIGGDARADITITGDPSLAKNPVTIVRDTISGHYTLVGNGSVSVNNRTVGTRRLQAGDVINFNGTIVVFDTPEHTSR